MTLDRLTGQDLTHLVADEFGWPGHIGAIGILDGTGLTDDYGTLRADDIRADVARRLHLLPRFRQIIQFPRWGLGGPLWVDAPTVDLAYHVQLLALPDRAGEDQLLSAVEAVRRRPFDEARPRWELWLLPGLSDGRVGVFIKLHHAVADGAAGVALLGLLLSPESATDPSQRPRWLPAGAPATADLLRDNVWRLARRLGEAVSALAHPVRTVARVREVWPAIREVLGGESRSPRTSLNRPIGRGRRMALVRHSLADTKDVAHTAGATVNDVALAAVAGGLREVLVARGEPVDGLVLRIAVPVSLHRRPRAAHGNLDAPMAVPVPVGERDAAVRLRIIAADSVLRRARTRPQVFAGLLSSRPAQRLILRFMRRQRLVNAYVANVPGPTEPLRLVGATLLELFALVPITANVTLGVGVISYAGQLNLTIVADQTSWPDLPVFLGGLQRAWSQLTDHAPHVATSNASRVTKP